MKVSSILAKGASIAVAWGDFFFPYNNFLPAAKRTQHKFFAFAFGEKKPEQLLF